MHCKSPKKTSSLVIFAQIPFTHLDLFSSFYAIEFCSLASGSSGNCYYIAHHDGALLIDAGLSLRRIEKSLMDIGRSLREVSGVLLTHNHTDHTSGLESMSAKYSFNIFASRQVISAVLDSAENPVSLERLFVEISPNRSFVAAGFRIFPFEVEHDAPGTVGYHLTNNCSSLTLATDLGNIGHHAASMISRAEVLILESNFDGQMLKTGPYPSYLKQRISSRSGHLGNHQAATFVAQHCHTNLKHLFLAHLSKENNKPEKVINTFEQSFLEHGFNLNQLETFVCLDRTKCSGLYRF